MVTIYRLAPPESNVVEKVCVGCGLGAECDMESLFRSDFSARAPGVSKMVTVDVKGSAPLWMKIKDLADGVTYNFRIRAKTLTYGPEVEANITTGPGEGKSPFRGLGGALSDFPTLPQLIVPLLKGAPGPPGEPFISRYGSALTLHWTSGDQGRAAITRYVIEARPSGKRKICSLKQTFGVLKSRCCQTFNVVPRHYKMAKRSRFCCHLVATLGVPD